MSLTAARPARLRGADAVVLAAVAGLGLLMLTLAVAGNGDIALAIAPLLLALVVLAVVRAPLRYSLLALAFLCLTLENPSDAPPVELWRPPLYTLAILLHSHLNLSLPVPALIFSGLDVALVLLAGVWVFRRMNGSTVDLQGNVPPAPPLRRAGLACLAAIFAIWAVGMVRADFSFGNSLWQIFRVIYLPCVFLFFCAALRGPADIPAMGGVLLTASLLHAALAVYMRLRFPDDEVLPYATTHADSMLFCDGFVLLLALFFERPTRKRLILCGAGAGLIAWGMVANSRRMVWVELVACLVVLYFITPMTRLKRRLVRGVVIALPVLAIYLAAGWSSGNRVFAPVRLLRSVVDSRVDTSTMWRDLENYNLYYTLRTHPFGTGFGHAYIEQVKLPDISGSYSLYRYAPHNSVLALLVYCGPLGFAFLWMMVPLGIFFAARTYRAATSAMERTAALTCVGVLVSYIVHCYGDMGLGTMTSVFTVGPALALVAKQAVATSAWTLPRPAPARPD